MVRSSDFFPPENSNIFHQELSFLAWQEQDFKQLGHNCWQVMSMCSLLPYGTGIWHYALIYIYMDVIV